MRIKGWTRRCLGVALMLGVLLPAGGIAYERGGESGIESLLTFDSQFNLKYTSPHSVEAVVRYSHFVEMRTSSEPSQDEAIKQVHQQVTHLFGPMERHKIKAVPKMDHEVEVQSIQRDESRKVYRVNYTYEGGIAVHDSVGSTLQLILPRNPDRIYGQAVVWKNNERHFPCTDSDHTESKYFWYFWSPDRRGCQLKEGEHYDRVTAQVSKLPNTTETYPEYERLKTADGEVSVHILIGMDNPFESTDPQRSDDVAARTYNKIAKILSDRGYESRKWSEAEIRKLMNGASNKLPTVATFTKQWPRATMKVRMFFGPSGEMQSKPFHYFFEDALENASVMIYAGHSGLGEYIAPRSLERSLGEPLKPPKDRYQIWFFNSCSSYPYFNRDYFNLKAEASDPDGSKDLDIITNGLSTYFYALTPSTLSVFNAIEKWAKGYGKDSYQSIMSRGDTLNFMAVNGDKDNPTQR